MEDAVPPDLDAAIAAKRSRLAELHRAILVGRAALLAAQRPPSADAAGAPAPAPDTAALTVSLATLQATYLDQVEQLKALLRLKHGGADRRRSRR